MCRENVSFVITTDIDSSKQGNAFIGSLGITICGFCFDFTEAILEPWRSSS